MDHLEFNTLFDDEFADPLTALGFAFVRSSKSLRYQNGPIDLWIKRIGGKRPQPGVARMAIAVRHSFLRPVSSDDPGSSKLIMDDFPRKLTFEDFDGGPNPDLTYRPQNMGRWGTSAFVYGNQTPKTVRQCLRDLKDLVETRVLPWAASLSATGELDQIIKFGDGAWCETRWIEDYRAHISGQRD